MVSYTATTKLFMAPDLMACGLLLVDPDLVFELENVEPKEEVASMFGDDDTEDSTDPEAAPSAPQSREPDAAGPTAPPALLLFEDSEDTVQDTRTRLILLMHKKSAPKLLPGCDHRLFFRLHYS